MILPSRREWNLLAPIKTLHTYFRHSALFINAHFSVEIFLIAIASLSLEIQPAQRSELHIIRLRLHSGGNPGSNKPMGMFHKGQTGKAGGWQNRLYHANYFEDRRVPPC
jgi:hypothetical protein